MILFQLIEDPQAPVLRDSKGNEVTFEELRTRIVAKMRAHLDAKNLVGESLFQHLPTTFQDPDGNPQRKLIIWDGYKEDLIQAFGIAFREEFPDLKIEYIQMH